MLDAQDRSALQLVQHLSGEEVAPRQPHRLDRSLVLEVGLRSEDEACSQVVPFSEALVGVGRRQPEQRRGRADSPAPDRLDRPLVERRLLTAAKHHGKVKRESGVVEPRVVIVETVERRPVGARARFAQAAIAKPDVADKVLASAVCMGARRQQVCQLFQGCFVASVGRGGGIVLIVVGR